MKGRKSLVFYQFLVLSHLFLMGCASLNKNKIIVSIDTQPRGVKVNLHRPERRYIGTTPFFYKMEKGGREVFELDFIDQNKKHVSLIKEVQQANSDCGIIWADHLGRYLPFVSDVLDFVTEKVLPVEVDNPMNYLSGGRVDCKSQIEFSLPTAIKPAPVEECSTYVVIPAVQPYKKLSDKISNRWIDQNFRPNKKSCDQVIEPYQSEIYLNFLGISYLSKKEGISYMSSQQLAKIGYKFKATHIVMFESDQNDDNYTAKPKIYDLHTRKEIKTEGLIEPINLKQKISNRFKLADHFRKSFRLLPNTVNLKWNFFRTIDLQDESRERFRKTERWKASIIPGPRLSSVDYPHYNWGFNLRYSPSMSWSKWREDHQLDLINLFLAAKMALHTPLGGIQLRAGIGPTFVDFENAQGTYRDKKFILTTHFRIGHFTFISERYYILVDANFVRVPEGKIQHDDFHLKTITTISFRLGYYWPEMKMMLRKLIFD